MYNKSENFHTDVHNFRQLRFVKYRERTRDERIGKIHFLQK